jgi:hypothetical protein
MYSNEYITNAGGLGSSSKEAVKPAKPTQGKKGLKATQKSYCLIVLRDRESLLQGEAGSRN